MWKAVSPQYETKEVSSSPSTVNVSVSETKWSIKRAFFEVTLPAACGILLVLPVYLTVEVFKAQQEQPLAVSTKTPQIPVNRHLVVPVSTIDDRDFILTLQGRQIDNYEKDNWCEYAWSGKISEMVAKSGTVHVNGKYHLDDIVSSREGGIERAIEQDLVGQSLRTENCWFDILSIELKEQR